MRIKGISKDRLRHLAVAIIVLMILGFVVGASSWVIAQGQPGISATISVDNSEKSVSVPEGTTVLNALRGAGVFLAPKDEMTPAKNDPVRSGTRIEVVRVVEKTEVTTEPMPFKTVFKPTAGFRGASSKTLQAGKLGQLDKVYVVTTRDGVESGRKLTAKKVTQKPLDRIVMIPASGRLPSRGYFTGRKVLRMVATGYDPGPRSCGKWATGGRTACGLRAGYGVVAVDPRYIPLGTRLYVEGYGYAVAGDTGGAIKGNRIDLGHDTYRAAVQVGMRTVTVHVLD